MPIRSATVNDIAALLALEQRSPGAAHWTSAQYEKLFAVDEKGRSSLVLVTDSADLDSANSSPNASTNKPSIDAFLIARCVAGEWELENLAVSTEQRGKRVATNLLEEFKDHAIANQGSALFLEVRESNQPARRLYEKCGFEQTGRRFRYYIDPVEDAVLYRMKLRP